MQRPKRPEAGGGVTGAIHGIEQRLQRGHLLGCLSGARIVADAGGDFVHRFLGARGGYTLLQHASGMAAEPFVLRPHQRDQLVGSERGQIRAGHRLVLIDDLVDAAAGVIVAVVPTVVALVGVVPVDHENAAVGVEPLVEGLGPAVIEVEEVLAVLADIAGATGDRQVDVHALAMDVSDDQVVAIRGRPARAQVAQHAGVGMAATHGIAAPIGGVRPGRTGPVHVVGMRADVFVHIGEDALATALIPVLGVALRLVAVVGVVLAALPEDPSSLDHVEEVRNDAHFGPEVAVLIEVDAPRIAAALGENLESVGRRMVTPDTRIDPLTIVFRGPRLANMGRTKHPVATIEPPIGTPVEGVERLVGVGGVVPAIQQNLRIAGRFGRIAVGNGNEHQVRSRTDPKTAKAKLHSGDQVDVLQEHRAFVGLVVAVGVLKHEDAIFA